MYYLRKGSKLVSFFQYEYPDIDLGSIPGLGRSPGEGNGALLRFLGNFPRARLTECMSKGMLFILFCLK